MLGGPASQRVLADDSGYPSLKEFIIRETGLAYYADKDDDLMHRVSRRLAESRQPNCAAYLALLAESESGEKELDRLVEELTVGETSFFRHAELFAALREVVLPDLLESNRETRRLRIWSAGCSIGAEPYSVAILLAREFSGRLSDWNVSILGTDINREFLDRARAGVFRAWDFRGTEESCLEACFERRGDTWTLHPQFRRLVRFEHHNLMRDFLPDLWCDGSGLDLILCRNVLMYFDRKVMERLIDQFHARLSNGGWLLVGHAETNIELFRKFETINVPNAVLYRERTSVRPPAALAAPVPVLREPERTMTQGADRMVPGCRAELRPEALPPNLSAPRIVAGERGTPTTRLQEKADEGNLDQAVRECRLEIKNDPMNPALHLHLAMLCEQLGHDRQAEQALRRALYLNPDIALAHYFSGLIEQRRGRHAQAARAYQTTVKLLSDKSDDAPIAESEGMTTRELRELTRMRQEVLAV